MKVGDFVRTINVKNPDIKCDVVYEIIEFLGNSVKLKHCDF